MTRLRAILTFPLVRLLISVLCVAAALFVFLTLFLGGTVPENPSLALHAALYVFQTFGVGVALVIVVTLIERRSFADIGLGLHASGLNLLVGASAGALLVSLVIGILMLGGFYYVEGIVAKPGLWTQLLAMAGIVFLISLFEEVMFRGLGLRILEEMLGSWGALLLSATFFGLAHYFNPNGSISGAFGTFLGGLFLGAIYVTFRNLWLAVGVHWGWNFAQGQIFGSPVSGNTSPHLLQSNIQGPDLWTGGAFGPESSLVSFIVLVITICALLALAVRRGTMRAPLWLQRSSSPEHLAAGPALGGAERT